MMVGENIVDQVARALGLPVEDVRLRNMYRAMGDKTHFGQAIEPFQVRITRIFFSKKYVVKYYTFCFPN